MPYNSLQSIFYGLLFGVAPGVLLGAIGLALGGEWAWTLGFIALWLIVIGLFAGPLLGSVGPEIVAERPVSSGAIIGAIPGVVLVAIQRGENGWVWILAILGGSVLGAFAGHWIYNRSRRVTDLTHA
ncbi:MAG: hypothetical protein U9N56_05095 [Actinomycetota bacterium]|nr:hypothetical protein [Actinomycetota bacterium]